MQKKLVLMGTQHLVWRGDRRLVGRGGGKAFISLSALLYLLDFVSCACMTSTQFKNKMQKEMFPR